MILVQAVKVCYEEMMRFHIGQGAEIYWRDRGICPNEEEYKDMVLSKTSSFLMLTLRLLQLFSRNNNNYNDFCSLLGYYMQVKNDYCNLMCTKVTKTRIWRYYNIK